MDTSLYKYLVGRSINISRSDGRVHLATVKTVDTIKYTVMVEWQEKGNCRGKEVEVSELCALNPELLEIKAPEKKYDGRLRSSRIPAPSSFSLRNQSRQTCLFQANPNSGSSSRSEQPAATGITNSANSNQRPKKNEAKPMLSLAEAREAAKENDEPEKVLPQSAKGRRKSAAPQELHKASKRMSCVTKPQEMQPKRGKFAEPTRPNQKFYDMIKEFRETLEIMPLLTTEVVEAHRICVCVRKRPLNKQEINKKEIDVVSVPGKGTLLVHEPKQKVDLTKYLDNQVFKFDYSFDETTSNDLVYK